MVAIAGFEPTTIRSKGINSTNAPPLIDMQEHTEAYTSLSRGTSDCSVCVHIATATRIFTCFARFRVFRVFRFRFIRCQPTENNRYNTLFEGHV